MASIAKAAKKAYKKSSRVKKQVGGLPQGYDPRLRRPLAARPPVALGRRPYAPIGTMDRVVKKGGSVRRKKGSTVSRKSGGKVMQGYKAGGKV